MTPLLLALVESGILGRDDAERIHRQLDPDEARAYAERTLTESFQRGLSAQQRRILAVLDDTQGQPTARQMARLWGDEDALLYASVQDDLVSVATEQAVRASISTVDPDMWMLVNEEVSKWVEDWYTSPDASAFGSIPNLNATSRSQFANAFEMWQRGDRTPGNYADGLPQLINELVPIFGPERASRIGITEVSRVFAQSELHAARANEFVVYLMWETGRDEHVCPICGPRQGQVVSKEVDGFRMPTDNTVGYPPAHVRCRCALTQLTAPAYEALKEQGMAGPVAPTSVAPPTWKPTMSRQEADAWAAGSAYKEPLYHGTGNTKSAASIGDNGFSLSGIRGGRVYGDGVYLSPEKDQADFWAANGQRQAGVTLPIQINVKNPLIVDRAKWVAEIDRHIAEQFPKDKPRGTYEGFMAAMAKAKTDYVTSRGHDALIIRAPRDDLFKRNFTEWIQRYGGDQAIVFDPKNVTVVRD